MKVHSSYSSSYGVFITILLIFISYYSIISVEAKKTAKEWQEFNAKKLAELERLEQDELNKALGNEVQFDKPGMIFANFPPKVYDKKEKEKIATKWNGQLQSAGVKVQIFETGEEQWVVTTFRTKDIKDVVKYLRQQVEVMKVTVDSKDWWQLPKFQKEYEIDQEEKKRVQREAEERRRELQEKEAPPPPQGGGQEQQKISPEQMAEIEKLIKKQNNQFEDEDEL
jgi:hypothetical protein